MYDMVKDQLKGYDVELAKAVMNVKRNMPVSSGDDDMDMDTARVFMSILFQEDALNQLTKLKEVLLDYQCSAND